MREIGLQPGAERAQAQLTAGPPDAAEPQSVPEASDPVETPLAFEAAAGEASAAPGMPGEVAPERVAGAAVSVGAKFTLEAPQDHDVQVVADEAPLRDQQVASRRHYARFLIGGKAKGRVTAIYDAVVLDISMGGSLIEHSGVVRPGTLSSLDLDLGGAHVRLRCRVARSVVNRSETLPGEERELIYHTGVEFLDPSEETRLVISRYIRTMMKAPNSG
ncbi:MAG TPA: PilZ domain-containing protein [Candidatus Methylomirabilis sp.]|nr:PilZ domain-containing protein [Candidatus Methylomirabilis sp.]